jgi:hypothetical protein
MEDVLILVVTAKGENIMGNPLLSASGLALIGDEPRVITVNTPVTSVLNFIEAFEGLFQEEKAT